ncbi:hypothetical protein [Catenulispora sp. EB89]|uniref:hypothetical protein n=1 Tax=Catenulispora sp. EB89 TaxID=3156257 RepID=UPI0035127980
MPFINRRIAATATAVAAGLGMAIMVAGPASASATACDNPGSANVCMDIEGSSNLVTAAQGSAQITKTFTYYENGGFFGVYSGYVQVYNPNGAVLCSSRTTALNAGLVLDCDPGDLGYTLTGNYCTKLFVNSSTGFHDYREECVDVL